MMTYKHHNQGGFGLAKYLCCSKHYNRAGANRHLRVVHHLGYLDSAQLLDNLEKEARGNNTKTTDNTGTQ